MKRFLRIVFFLIILGFAGLVAYRGWLGNDLDKEEFGVLYSKLTGYKDALVEPGKPVWHWEGVIPGNSELIIYKIRPQIAQIQLEETLPSGNVFSAVMPGKPSFSIKLNIEITYSLDLSALIELTEGGELLPERLNTWYSTVELKIKGHATRFLRQEIGSYSPDEVINDAELLIQNLKTYLQREESSIIIKEVLIHDRTFPDMEIYSRARQYYDSLLEGGNPLEEAQNTVSTITGRLSYLSALGGLLADNPELASLLQIMAESNPDVLIDILSTGTLGTTGP